MWSRFCGRLSLIVPSLVLRSMYLFSSICSRCCRSPACTIINMYDPLSWAVLSDAFLGTLLDTLDLLISSIELQCGEVTVIVQGSIHVTGGYLFFEVIQALLS